MAHNPHTNIPTISQHAHYMWSQPWSYLEWNLIDKQLEEKEREYETLSKKLEKSKKTAHPKVTAVLCQSV